MSEIAPIISDTDPRKSPLPPEAIIAYRYIIPIIAIVGILGNVINLIVLSSKEIKYTVKGHRISKRSKSMFRYMRALATTDLLYLIWNLQGCYFTLMGYYRSTDPEPTPTKGLGMYIWNYFSPMFNGFASASDFIVVVMTAVRYQIVRNVDNCGTIIAGSDTNPICFIILAVFAGLLMHLPYVIQFNIQICHQQLGNETEKVDCWEAEQSKITQSVLWQFYGYVYQGVVKVIPILLIMTLNILMLLKMKQIMRKRKELRQARQARQSIVPTLLSDEDNPRRPSNVLALPQFNSEGVSTDQKSTSRSGSTVTYNQKQRESIRQFKLNSLLLVLAFFHCITTLPGNLAFLMWTVFPNEWNKLNSKGIFATVANVMYVMNYSKNFYLYCFVHEDIRRIAMDKFKRLIQKFS